MSFSLGPWQWDIQQTVDLVAVLVAGTVLLISLIITLWSIARRLFKRSPVRFSLVLMLNLLAYGSLALLLAPPFTLSTVDQSVVLLTAGTQIDDIESRVDLFVAPGTDIEGKVEPGTSASWLLDIGQLRLQRPAISRLSVLGHGLTAEQWTEIPERAEVHFQATPLIGLTEIRWPGHLTLGERLVVSGRYQGLENQATRLELIDPAGQAVDKVLLRPGQDFSLSATPQVAGRHRYLLRLWHEDQVVTEDTVAVSVVSGRGARLLVIQSAPSFETRQLKNWAADLGTPMLILTRISRDRHISQAVNLADDADTKLSPALLAQQDLVIMDGRSWLEFADSQREWLNTAVQDGLGLLVLADHALAGVLPDVLPMAGDGLLGDFSMYPVGQENELTLPSWPGADPQTPLPYLPFRLEARHGSILVGGENGQALGMLVSVGRGQVTLSILREKYRWLGVGERATYTAYWAMLMRETGRQRGAPYLLPVPEHRLNTVARKMKICALGNGQAMSANIQGIRGQSPFLKKGSVPLFLSKDRLGSARYCAVFWPTEPGWHQVFLKDKASGELVDQQSFYVFNSSDWLTHRQQLKQQASLQRVARNPLHQDQMDSRVVATPLSAFWPWLVLIVAAGLLWLERKLL